MKTPPLVTKLKERILKDFPNIKLVNFNLPTETGEDCGILADVLEPQVDEKYYIDPKICAELGIQDRIRRLTPLECERVQSFPDNLTKFGRKQDGTVYEISDTQRYKLAGNAVSSKASKLIIESTFSDPSIKVMSLFSGCGGTEARLDKRFELIGHCEIDKYAQDVLRFNHPDVKIYNDVSKLADGTDQINTQFDLLTFGYPCQDISISGKQLGEAGKRSSLVYKVVEIAKIYRPKYILAENVKNHLSKKHVEFFLKVLSEFSNLGYEIDFELINSKHCGICQNRERVFIVGKRA
jgi:site-specific DNA-cytosine methylase